MKEREDLSKGFDAGNYANAQTTDLVRALFNARAGFRSPAFNAGFVLGFFSSYERHEILSDDLDALDAIPENTCPWHVT